MTSVFIGGSRKISRLNSAIQNRIDCIISKKFKILVGDANGADKAVQTYLHDKHYNAVEVFCAEKKCRNNVGNWMIREIDASGRKGFDFYAAKDQAMAEEASYGFMIWDGESSGTLMNVQRMIDKNKKVALYISTSKTFVEIKNKLDWNQLLDNSPCEVKTKVQSISLRETDRIKSPIQMVLYSG